MSRRELLMSATVGVVAAAIAWLRLEGRTRGVVWAEDGVFLHQRLESTPLSTLLDPYQGYLHVLPRAIVEAAVLLPVQEYAVAVTALSCLVVGAVAALVHVCSRDVLQTGAARIALALVAVLVPTAAAEVLGNTANLHWFLLWLTPWVLLCRPTSLRQGYLLGALLLVVGLSEIQVVMFAPLVLVGIRDRRRWPIVAGFVGGASTQVLVTIVHGRPAGSEDTGTPSLLDLVQGYGLHVFLQMWRPAYAGVGDLLVQRGWVLVVAASVPFLAVLAALAVSTTSRQDLVVTLTVLTGAVVPFVAGIALNFRSFLAFADFGLESLAAFAPLRYAVVPSMFALAAAVVVADRLARRRGRVREVLGGVLLVAVLGLGLLHLGAGPTVRSGSPGWSASVDRAADVCRRTDAATVSVPTAPEGWQVTLDCAVLTGGRGRG